jgi:hypothetical protein
MTSYTGHEPGLRASEPQPPLIEELTVEPPAPGRSAAELSAIMQHSMGLADAPAQPHSPALRARPRHCPGKLASGKRMARTDWPMAYRNNH